MPVKKLSFENMFKERPKPINKIIVFCFCLFVCFLTWCSELENYYHSYLHIDGRIIFLNLKKNKLDFKENLERTPKAISNHNLSCHSENKFKKWSLFGEILCKRVKQYHWFRKFQRHNVLYYERDGVVLPPLVNKWLYLSLSESLNQVFTSSL